MTAPTEKSGGNLSSELEIMKKLRIQGTEDGTFDQEYDDQIDEDNGATDRQHGSDFKTNRSKIKQRK